MAIKTTSIAQGGDGGRAVAGEKKGLRLNVFTGLIVGVLGYLFGHWMGNAIAGGYQQVVGSGQNDVAILLGFIFGTIGWFLGLGILNYPIQKMAGVEPPVEKYEYEPGVMKYFRYTLDNKVVGIQYLFGMLFYFFTAGLLAMGIRTELLSPTNHIWGPATYLEIVGEHGT